MVLTNEKYYKKTICSSEKWKSTYCVEALLNCNINRFELNTCEWVPNHKLDDCVESFQYIEVAVVGGERYTLRAVCIAVCIYLQFFCNEDFKIRNSIFSEENGFLVGGGGGCYYLWRILCSWWTHTYVIVLRDIILSKTHKNKKHFPDWPYFFNPLVVSRTG